MQKKLLQIQEKMQNILKEELDVSVKVTKLEALIKEVKNVAGTNTKESYEYVSTIQEAIGDTWVKGNRIVEGEKAYRSMLANSKLLYELNPKELDYRFGFSCYKMASYYMTMMGCHKLSENPKPFNDMQKQIFKISDDLYKRAITSTMANARKGLVQYAKLQAMAMSELALLHASNGAYKMAAGFGIDGINVSKSVYNTIPNKEHLYVLINRINHQATIYKLMKKTDKTIACLEESIALAKEKLSFDKVVLGVMIGKCYMNIGACYDSIDEVLKADDAFEKGLEALAQANKASEYHMYDEVIKGYMKVGDHYLSTKRDNIARSYYGIAYEKASLAYEEKEEIVYKNLMHELEKLLGLQ